MAFREKHRLAAMIRRVEQGRTIKSDLNPDGTPTKLYEGLRLLMGPR